MSARKKEALTNIRSIQELASAATAANPGGALRHQAIVVAEASAALGRKDISYNFFIQNIRPEQCEIIMAGNAANISVFD